MDDDARVEPRADVPEHLLVPLVEAAADTLRALDHDDVPAALRHLHGFDRRGLLHGPAPRQLRRAFTSDAAFRERVLDRFGAQPSVQGVLAGWPPPDPWKFVEATAERQDLALLASVCWACRPVGADYVLGLLVAFDAAERRGRGDAAAVQAQAREVAALEEARRRAEAARLTAVAEAARAGDELREERRARRGREEQAVADSEAARRRADALEAQLQQVAAAGEDTLARAGREAARARALETDLRNARERIAELAAAIEAAPSRLDERDARVLADAITATERIAAQLEALRTRVETQSRSATGGRGLREPEAIDKPLARRVRPPLPAGMVASSPDGVDAMLRGAGVLLVIDGYNVTKTAWPEATAAEQRERLGSAVTQLHRRTGCDVLCVFDGDGSTARPVIRRGNIRVLFSDAGEEADEVIVREVVALPKRIPIVVASSDAWVREHAEAAGAIVVPADALLAVMGRR
jgi:predicted RNA-binding protein with PIN domain